MAKLHDKFFNRVIEGELTDLSAKDAEEIANSIEKIEKIGYQIIDLGEVDLTDTVTINKGTNADADVLLDLSKRKKLHNKPVLLHLHEANSDMDITAFVTTTNDILQIFMSADDLSDKYVIFVVIAPLAETVTISMNAL